MPTQSLSQDTTSPKDWWTLAILLTGVLGIFTGQAWLFHRGQAPLMALLQNEDLVRPLVENQLGIDWNTWVSDPAINHRIMTGLRATSSFLGLCAAAAVALPFLRSEKRPVKLLRRVLATIILTGVACLILLAWLSYLDHNQVAFHYLEYSTQVVTPLVLVRMIVRKTRPGPWLGRVARVALALTFTIHGFYAMGLEIPGSTSMLWSLPGSWVEMTVNGLGKAAAVVGSGTPSEEIARQILFHIGIIDLVAAVVVLLPKVRNSALIYMAAWGLLTALARTWCNFHSEFAAESLAQWIPETLVRLPHFALPAFLIAVSFRSAKTSPSANPISP